MKPDDILNAIGEVEDKYVKRAHRKDLLKAVLWFAGTFTVLVMLTSMWMEPDYILSRIEPDFTVNTGYVEPEHLEKDNWTTMEYTAYENGVETARTVFRRRLYDHYTVTHTTADGEPTVLVGRAGIPAREYIGEKDIATFYMETYYSEDLIGRIDSMTIGSRFAHETPYEMLNYLKMEYLASGFLIKQVLYSGKENPQPVGWRIFDYTNSKLSGTKDYDGAGNLLGYAEYTYEGYTRKSESYTPEGVLTGTTEVRYDWFDNIRERIYYDAYGNLTGREMYRYRFWERYLSAEGLATLFMILSFAATMGIFSWEERLRLPRRKIGAERLAAKLEKVRTALEEAEALLDTMDEKTRAETGEQLAGEVKAIRRLLKRLDQSEKEEGQ